MKSGWYKESHRHSLAAKGVKTNYYAYKAKSGLGKVVEGLFEAGAERRAAASAGRSAVISAQVGAYGERLKTPLSREEKRIGMLLGEAASKRIQKAGAQKNITKVYVKGKVTEEVDVEGNVVKTYPSSQFDPSVLEEESVVVTTPTDDGGSFTQKVPVESDREGFVVYPDGVTVPVNSFTYAAEKQRADAAWAKEAALRLKEKAEAQAAFKATLEKEEVQEAESLVPGVSQTFSQSVNPWAVSSSTLGTAYMTQGARLNTDSPPKVTSAPKVRRPFSKRVSGAQEVKPVLTKLKSTFFGEGRSRVPVDSFEVGVQEQVAKKYGAGMFFDRDGNLSDRGSNRVASRAQLKQAGILSDEYFEAG